MTWPATQHEQGSDANSPCHHSDCVKSEARRIDVSLFMSWRAITDISPAKTWTESTISEKVPWTKDEPYQWPQRSTWWAQWKVWNSWEAIWASKETLCHPLDTIGKGVIRIDQQVMTTQVTEQYFSMLPDHKALHRSTEREEGSCIIHITPKQSSSSLVNKKILVSRRQQRLSDKSTDMESLHGRSNHHR